MLGVSWVGFTILVLCGIYVLQNPESLSVLSSDFPTILQRSKAQDSWLSWDNNAQFANVAVGGLISSAAALLCGIVYLVLAAGRSEFGGTLVLRPIDRIYADVHSGFVVLAAVLILMIIANGTYGYGVDEVIFWVLLAILSFISAMIGSSWVLSLVRLGKAGQLFTHTLLFQLYRRTVESFRFIRQSLFVFFANGRVWMAVVLAFAGFAAGNDLLALVFFLGARNGGAVSVLFGFVLLAGFNLTALYLLAKWVVALDDFMRNAHGIAAGNLEDRGMPKKVPALLRPLGEDLGAIRIGQRKAVAEAVRGERMKTDLITNVSHDLKTPLTSIVNYVDLLGKEELNNEQAVGYVKVLEEKSARMKQLVEDLVEASKASSGNLAVNAEALELNQLVLQACGEFEGKFAVAGLELRVRNDADKVHVLADGRHVWRILENLLTNVCKYSLNGTRVYVQTGVEGGKGVLMIKNVSATPLEIPVSQLMERFVRGDAARSTEGSGLGLSIARSLTGLLDGTFEIGIDGDLFKATVRLPLTEPPVGKPEGQVATVLQENA